ncbi:MAG: aspartate-semialdehyde dehydrogenase [Gammaproteobacteria bacterium]|nr:aspartate-semialdehyde dehydrogenase [Gammaproteobacteria bacterium]
MPEKMNVAVVGPDTLVGEALVQLLEEREFPLGKLALLALGEGAGGRVEFRGSHVRVQAIEGFDFSGIRLAFFCAGAELAARHAPIAAAAGAVVIDSSPRFRDAPDVPLLVADVNPQALAGVSEGRIVSSPSCGTIALAVALKPLHEAAGLTRVNVVTLQAVSGAGRAGVEELAKQTANLLNVRPIEPKVFPRQIAFNLLPQVDTFLDNGYTREEMKFLTELRRVLGLPGLGVNATAVRAPVFFGHSAAVHLETCDKLDVGRARTLLEAAPGVEVLDEHGADGFPTPVTEAAGQDPVWVGRLREDLSHPRGLDFWVVTENVRRQALNCIQIAEQLAKNLS